jgi:DNA-binding NarL/FixJ family response regulator
VSVRVLVADDQPLMRAAFLMTLRAEEDIEVVGEAADGREAVELVGRLRPDVVLMDIRMPDLDGVEATRLIVDGHPETRVLVLTTFDLDEYVVEALRAGASGFLLKDVRPEELVKAIRLVARGEALLDSAITRKVLDAFVDVLPPGASADRREIAELTGRELEVLRLVGRGLSNEEIAARLFVADTTVRTHIRHILEKLGLRNRVQAVVYAYESGLVRPHRKLA